jgi:hypothetical protein
VTGFGINEQYEAGMRLADQPLWRADSFLHQLSMNGSLMLAANHDDLWRSYLGTLLGSRGGDWDYYASLLRLLPASLVRQTLWRTSWFWWRTRVQAHFYTTNRLSLSGGLETTLRQPIVEHDLRDLHLRAWQLEALSWCRHDEADQGTITIVEHEREGVSLPRSRRRPPMVMLPAGLANDT